MQTTTFDTLLDILRDTLPDPLPDPGTMTPVPQSPEPKPIPGHAPTFPERHDDPEQAEELERQQDA